MCIRELPDLEKAFHHLHYPFRYLTAKIALVSDYRFEQNRMRELERVVHRRRSHYALRAEVRGVDKFRRHFVRLEEHVVHLDSPCQILD